MVLGRGGLPGHQRRRRQLLRRQQGRSSAPTSSRRRRRATLAGAITYDNLDQVSGCLNNDKTTIKNLLWKINYQLNSANKIQYLFQSDNKYRNRRDASATNAR